MHYRIAFKNPKVNTFLNETFLISIKLNIGKKNFYITGKYHTKWLDIFSWSTFSVFHYVFQRIMLSRVKTTRTRPNPAKKIF